MLKIKPYPTFLLFAFLLSSFFFLLNNVISSKRGVFFWMWSKPQTLSSSILSLSSYCKEINCKTEIPHVHFGTINKNNNFIMHLNIKDIENLKDFGNSFLLTFRLENLPSVYEIADTYKKYSSIFMKSKINIRGLELDYDSPSSKISAYKDWIKRLSKLLPKDHIEITGLTTWVYDNEQDTQELFKEVKRINFQLYHIDKNKIPTQRFFNFLNNISEKKISLGVMCNDYEFTKTITNSIKKSSKISIGYFLNSNCSKST
jgi:uncharacterized protein YktA (UPF0223 family)